METMPYKTVFSYRRQIIIITFLALIIALSGLNNTKAQVSGYMGDRFTASANLSQDLYWWLFNPANHSLGTKLEFDYVITRKSSIGLTGKFAGLEDNYDDVVNYFSYKNLVKDLNRKYDVSSNLIGVNYKHYRNKSIAPLGSYTRLSLGFLFAGHNFDKELYRDNIYLSDDDVNSSDVNIKKESSYSSFFLGIGFGETYPITDFLLFNIDVEFRMFTNSGNMVERLGLWSPDYYKYGKQDPERLIEKAVLTRAYIHNTVDISVGLIYTFGS